MTKRTVVGLVAAVAAVALLLGGVATASNMGFKFVPQIPGGTSNAMNLSLPWNNSYTTAQSLFTDLAQQTPGIQKVSKFGTNSKLVSWTAGGGTNFTVDTGPAYIVYGSGSGQTPVVVGSHDPSFTYTFTANQAYNAAAPYHQTLTTAKGLFDSLNAACPNAFAKVSKFGSNSKLVSWTAGGGTNFNLDLGMGVVIYPSASCSGYVWPHY